MRQDLLRGGVPGAAPAIIGEPAGTILREALLQGEDEAGVEAKESDTVGGDRRVGEIGREKGDDFGPALHFDEEPLAGGETEEGFPEGGDPFTGPPGALPGAEIEPA